MGPSDVELVQRTARLARLEISPAEAAELGPQFARVLAAFQALQGLDLSGVEPAVGATDLCDVVRDDVARPGLEREELLARAPRALDGFFGVPRTVGGEG